MAMEEARRDLQRRLEEVLGKEHALTLMHHLPGEEPATKADLHGVREEIHGFREELRGEIRATRTDLEESMRAMEARLRERIDLKVAASEHRVIGAVHQGLGELRKDLVAQTRVFVFSTLTAVVTVGGLAVAAGRFG